MKLPKLIEVDWKSKNCKTGINAVKTNFKRKNIFCLIKKIKGEVII